MSTLLTKIRQEPTIFLFRKMWYFSKGNRKNVVLYVFFFFIANGIILLNPLVLAFLLNEIQFNGITEENINKLYGIISLFVVTMLGFWVFHGPARVIERKNAFLVRRRYQQYLMKGTLDLDLQWHTDRDSGDTIDKIYKASGSLFDFSQRTYRILEIVLRLTGTCIVLMFFNIFIGVGALLASIGAFLVLYQFDRRLVPQYKKLNIFENTISARIFDTLSNITSIVILHIQKNVVTDIVRSMKRPSILFTKNVVLNEWKWVSGNILFRLIVVVPLAFYVFIALRTQSPVEVGTFSALYLYLANLHEIFFKFGGIYEDIIRGKTSVQNAESVEEAFAERGQRVMPATSFGELSIKNLSFSYDTGDRHANHLDDIAFHVTAGERIAIIGTSGSGKTTFLKVLHGLYPTTTEDVHLNKEQLSQALEHTDISTTLVPQEPELFSASIRENITFGLDYSDEEIYAVTNLAHFTEVIEQLPRGLDSKINEKGVNLSGGQKQRLALARALLFAQNKEIILLDESTSSVDPHNEANIYQDIFAHFKEKTIIASVHKMNLLKYFDRIIIFDNGKIIDEGTFDTLLKKNKNFAQLWEEYSQEHAK